MSAVAIDRFRALILRLVRRPPAQVRRWIVEREGSVLRLNGVLRTRDADALLSAVRAAGGADSLTQLDLRGLLHVDGGVVALLRAELAARGVHPKVQGGDEFRALFEIYGGAYLPPRRRAHESLAEEVGRATVHEIVDFEHILSFAGELAAALRRLVRDPRRGHWGGVPFLVERAGADAVPIVLVINFLIGFVMAYMAAHALALFGATFYVANLVGIAVTRQLAPIMTAIVVCGRSGAGFTSELGSMSVAEEIDALRTLGLEPFGWLVVPRIVSLILVLPALTLLGDLVGVAGGLLVGVTSLDMSVVAYVNRTREVLVPWDVTSGLIMSVAFAVAIALIACEQGMAAAGGAEGVGHRTTTTVVASLFAIVLLDTVFTVLFRMAGMS